MQDTPNIQQIQDSPLGGFLDYLNVLEKKIKRLEDKFHGIEPTPKNLDKLLYKPDKAAVLMDCSLETVYRQVKQGRLETCLGFTDMRIPHRAIENYINLNSSKKIYREKGSKKGMSR